MCTYLIIDQSDSTVDILKQKLKRIDSQCKIYDTHSLEEGISLYEKLRPRMLFLDLDFFEVNNFHCINELKCFDQPLRLTLMASCSDMAIQALRYSAIDFLLKPFDKHDIQDCIHRLKNIEDDEALNINIHRMTSYWERRQLLKINTRVGFEIIRSEDILYCEADGNYTNICLIDGQKQTTSTTLGCVIKQLPDDRFFRIGRSVVINLNYLKSVNRKEKLCQLKINSSIIELPLSNSRVQQLAEIF